MSERHQKLDWKAVKDERPRPDSHVLCWDGRHYHTAYYAEFGKPGAKPGEGNFIFNGCHWATHWMYLMPPDESRERAAFDELEARDCAQGKE